MTYIEIIAVLSLLTGIIILIFFAKISSDTRKIKELLKEERDERNRQAAKNLRDGFKKGGL